MIGQIKKNLANRVGQFLQSPTKTPPPVANPLATPADAGKSSISITKDISNTIPQNTQKDTSARKEGLELYMQEKRGERGNRMSRGGSSKGLVYTEGRFKGMSQGQADAIELKEYREMNPEDRSKYNVVDEGDYETGKKRSIEMEKIASETARENERLAKAGASSPVSPPSSLDPQPMSAPTPPPVTKPPSQTNREQGWGKTMDTPYSGKPATASLSNKSDSASTFQNQDMVKDPAPAPAPAVAPVSNPEPSVNTTAQASSIIPPVSNAAKEASDQATVKAAKALKKKEDYI